MELDITRFFTEAGMLDYSASVAEIGQDAGRITWAQACEDAPEYSILPNDEARDAFRRFVRGFGAWNDAEIAAWSDTELNALCMQVIAGDVRETGMSTESFDWDEYEAGASAGRFAGRMFRGNDGRIFYLLD